MKPQKSLSCTLTIAVLVLIGTSWAALAQFGGPILPLPTTIVLEKPALEEKHPRSRMINIGIGAQTYEFVLKDAFVNDPSGKFYWNDVWRSVQQFKPNFLVEGAPVAELAKMKPGDVVTAIGMYSMATRTLELNNVTPGAGAFAPKERY